MISQKHFDEIFSIKNLATEITFFPTFHGSAKNEFDKVKNNLS